MAPSSTGTMYTLFRDSPAGILINALSKNRLLKPSVYREDYIIPDKYVSSSFSGDQSIYHSGDSTHKNQGGASSPKAIDHSQKQEGTLDPVTSATASRVILVDWDSVDDPNNPANWPVMKKTVVTIITSALTASGYMASAIFTPAEGQMLEFFHTSQVRLMLGLTLFVWGYGLSPLFVSAMSESPMFGGRRWILLISQTLYMILQIPTALINHVSSFVVLRFLAGIFVGPPLSISAGCITDMFRFPVAAYVIIGWASGAVIGPFVGPLIGAALTHANTWRWSFWYLLIQAGVSVVSMIFFYPETSAKSILMRKAKHLRQITGNPNILAQGDIDSANTSLTSELIKGTWLPIKICLREPVLDLVNLHLCLIYAVVYLFFEAFPIVFVDTFGFTLVELGVAYAVFMIPVGLATAGYIFYLREKLVKPVKRGIPPEPEISYGYPSLLASVFIALGLFIFGWSATAKAHWMGPIMGACTFIFGNFIIFQSYIAYIGTLYPTVFASALASSTVLRSFVGGAFPLFGNVFYNNTAIKDWPVGWGSSILGFIGLAMVGLPIYFIINGAELRRKAYARWGVEDPKLY